MPARQQADDEYAEDGTHQCGWLRVVALNGGGGDQGTKGDTQQLQGGVSVEAWPVGSHAKPRLTWNGKANIDIYRLNRDAAKLMPKSESLIFNRTGLA